MYILRNKGLKGNVAAQTQRLLFPEKLTLKSIERQTVDCMKHALVLGNETKV